MLKVFPKEHWRTVHTGYRLPLAVDPMTSPDHHRLFKKHLDIQGGTVFEVGCAPGAFLAYFAKHFGMQPAGIEYVEEGALLTQENLSMQGLVGDIVTGDFFQTNLPVATYDVVFSAGFIEHWPDTQAVVNRIVNLAKEPGGYVITTVPNFLGVNGFVFKHWAPGQYASHVHISGRQLREYHEKAGVETLFCDYGAIPRIMWPKTSERTGNKKRPVSDRLLLFAISVVNTPLKRMCRYVGRVPRSRLLSPMMIYIGRRHSGR